MMILNCILGFFFEICRLKFGGIDLLILVLKLKRFFVKFLKIFISFFLNIKILVRVWFF